MSGADRIEGYFKGSYYLFSYSPALHGGEVWCMWNGETRTFYGVSQAQWAEFKARLSPDQIYKRLRNKAKGRAQQRPAPSQRKGKLPMATQILDQTIEYDKVAGAWGRYSCAGELVHYHDSEMQAIGAALPASMAGWVAHYAGTALDARAVKAARIVAENRIQANPNHAGCWLVTGDTGNVYSVHVGSLACDCEDKRHGQRWCKHLLAAHYVEREHRQAGATPGSLWDLAQAAVSEHQHEECNEKMEIWRDAAGQRSAYLAPMSEGHYLYLYLSGHAAGLRVAAQHYMPLPASNGNTARWDWTCRREDYKNWTASIK